MRNGDLIRPDAIGIGLAGVCADRIQSEGRMTGPRGL